MNRITSKPDIEVQTPAFMRFGSLDASKKNENKTVSMKQVRRFSWTRFIMLTIPIMMVAGMIWLLSKVVTPEVVTVVSFNAALLALRFIARVILKVTYTLLGCLFWMAVLCAIVICIL